MKSAAIIASAVGLMLALSLPSPASAVVRGKPVHALALLGEPAYGPDFKNFNYVNPNAPKGGTIVMSSGASQTFDTFNGFALKGAPARGFALIYDTLMVGGIDEPFTQYCLICETAEIAPDNSSVQFKLRPEARFQDGTPVTAEDVAFSFTILVEKGAPIYRLYWSDVAKVEVRDPHTVRFTFKVTDNRELPLILGQLPILSKAYWSKRDFTATTLDKPVGNGAYMIDSFEVGRYVSYKRDPKYWGQNLAVNRGQNNFDHVRYDYFRDDTVAFEAFKSGNYDLHYEATARQWATGYDFPAIKDGHVKKLEIADGTPMNAQSFTLNLRRPLFQDRRVRQALNYAFDFESLNRTIFYQQYTRLHSYWQKSDLEAKGPPTPAELALLAPLRDKIPAEVFTQEFTQPTTNGQGDTRANLLKARDLLAAAGWKLEGKQLVKDGKPFEFEVLEYQAGMQRILAPWVQNLERLGIKATIRAIDTTQFINRVNDFDYDVMSIVMSNSLSPGNEQREYWGSDAAGRPGSQNYSGVKDPAVDALIEKIVNAPDREALVTATHALDRVLAWNYFRVLTYSSGSNRFAYWAKLQHPDRFPLQGIGQGDGAATMWWMDPGAIKESAAK